jgi:hypothetical protein
MMLPLRNVMIIGKTTGFGMRELAPSFESGGNAPHSKYY